MRGLIREIHDLLSLKILTRFNSMPEFVELEISCWKAGPEQFSSENVTGFIVPNDDMPAVRTLTSYPLDRMKEFEKLRAPNLLLQNSIIKQ